MEHVHELIPSHVLGALDPEETVRVEKHLAECEECAADLRESEQTVAMLALTAPRMTPPPELRDRLMAAIDAPPAFSAELPDPEVADQDRKARQSRDMPGWWPRFARIAVPVLAVAVVGLFAWNISLRHDLTNTNDTIYGSATSVALPKVGTVFVDSSGKATMIADASAPPSGKTYQAWVIAPNSKPVSAGTFSGGRTSFDLPVTAQAGDTVAVTVEPAGGSAQPTTKPISASTVA